MALRIVAKLKSRWKTLLAIVFDTTMAVICFRLAYSLRYNSMILPKFIEDIYLKQLVLVLPIQVLTFYLSGFYKGIWRYSSTSDLIRLFRGLTISTITTTLALFVFNRLETMPRSVIFINYILMIVSLGGGRFAYRVLKDHRQNKNFYGNKQNVLIVGAGNSGEQLLRSIFQNNSLGLHVVGFVDDNTNLQGKFLHSIPVLGFLDDLPHLTSTMGIRKVFVAIPSATSKETKRIIEICSSLDCYVRTLPKMSDLIGGNIEVSQLRKFEIEDLLGRPAVKLDQEPVKEMITDEVILISGAGGSIGSELCHQIARFNPKKLILFELSEYNLYQLESSLHEKFPHLEFNCVIGDSRSLKNVEYAMKTYQPKVVFHAAAYKHVPMMERNPLESVRTNILGTKNFAEISLKYNVDRFVLVSTDKAVNPSNIMGATKRISEIVCGNVQESSKTTKFMTVRFGNVLGSSGSVVPRFKKQIEEGGPITVTHPDINRYFMSIPEAAQLILQAGSIGNGGELFVLDMGKPIKIIDLAKQMIELSGLTPGEDIEIVFSGLRPGEKLYEELLFETEDTLPTVHERVRIAKARKTESNFAKLCEELINLPADTDYRTVREKIATIVPEYSPKNTIESNLSKKKIFQEGNIDGKYTTPHAQV